MQFVSSLVFLERHMDKAHNVSKPTESSRLKRQMIRPKSAKSVVSARSASPNGVETNRSNEEDGNVKKSGQILSNVSVEQDPAHSSHVTNALCAVKPDGVKSLSSPPRSPVHLRPATQPSSGKRIPSGFSGAVSSRLTKPPVPHLSSRSKRPAAIPETLLPVNADHLEEKPEIQLPVLENPDCPSPILSTPNYAPYCPYAPCMMPAPGYYHPMMYPATTLYGNIHQDSQSTIVYTSGPIPPNTTSIILVPMQSGYVGYNPTPSPVSAPSVRLNGSISSGDNSVYAPNQPLVVFIERNVFKHWFDANVPACMGQLPRVKRYKSVETFMHWLTSKMKFLGLKLILLIRVTEVSKLINELAKQFPTSVMHSRVLKNVFTYEHLFNVSDQPGKCLKIVSEELARDNKFSVSHCLEDACKLALESIVGDTRFVASEMDSSPN